MLGRFGVAVWPRVLALLLAVCLLSGCDFGAKPKTKTTKKKTAASRPGEPLSWPNMPMGDTVASGGSGPDTGSAPGNGSGHDNRSVNSPPVSAFAPATYSIGAIPAGGPAEPATAFFDHDLFPVETARLERQTAPLSDVKYSSDGGAILTLTEDGEVRVVDASSRAVVRSIRPFGVLGGETFIRGNALAVRPDGKQIAVAAGDKIQLLAIGEDAPPKVIEGIKPPIKDLEYSADGQRLLALEGEHCATWNLDGRRLITGVDAVPIEFYAEFLNISPDGGLIAIEKDGVVTVYDVGGGAIVKRLDAALPHMDAAVFSPNGKMLAVAAGDWGKKTISVFEWPTGKLLHTVTPKDSLTGMAFLRDGRTLVADGFLVYLIDAPTGRVLYEGPRDTGASTAYFAVNPRCDEFIELKHGAMDELVIHALQPSPELKTLRTPEPKNEASIRLAGSSDGASLAAADGKRIFIWNAESAELIADVAAEADAFTFAADGARLFTNESYKTVARNSAGGAPQGEPIDSLQPLHTVPKTNLIVQRNSEQQLVLVDLASPGESRSLGGPQESSAIDYVAHVA
ncbi:MAG TPA: hypothetical protein VGE52_20380, partial [Pirellulales bacterium]